MKYFFSLLFLFLSFSSFADGPFRVHRFNLLSSIPVDSNAILFVGNSITDMFCWSEAFNNPYVLNRGVSGALSSEILQHVDSFISGSPKAFFLMIGTNDLASGISPDSIAHNVRQIVSHIQSKSPSTQIFLQSILPSSVGNRTLESEIVTNTLIRNIAAQHKVTFIDLWDALSKICTSPDISADGLHLMAAGYQIWCDLLTEYFPLLSLFPSNTLSIQSMCDLPGSFGMRASYFTVMPIDTFDILFFGDEMVKNGEWIELLPDYHILNRGTGWGYDGTANSIAITSRNVDACFEAESLNHKHPSAIILYTGTGNVNGDMDVDTVFRHYTELVDKISIHEKDSKVFLVSLLPTCDKNPRIKHFNKLLRRYCKRSEHCDFIDIYSPLAQYGKTNSRYFSGNYLMADGYFVVASLIEHYLQQLN